MRTRAAVTAVVLALLGGGAGGAGAAPYCNLLRTTADNENRTPGSPAWDEALRPGSAGDYRLRSGDVATNGRHLTAAIRLRSMDSSDPTRALQGRRLSFSFSATDEHHYVLSARIGRVTEFTLHSTTQRWYAPDEHPPAGVTVDEMKLLGPATGVVDRKRGEVRMTVPLSAFARDGSIRPGGRLRHLGATVATVHGDFDGSPSPLLDEAAVLTHRDAISGWRRYYPVGAASCVPVGR